MRRAPRARMNGQIFVQAERFFEDLTGQTTRRPALPSPRPRQEAAAVFDAVARAEAATSAESVWFEDETWTIVGRPRAIVSPSEIGDDAVAIVSALGEGRLATTLVVGEDIAIEALFDTQGRVRADTLILRAFEDDDDRRRRKEERRRERRERREQRQQRREQNRRGDRGSSPSTPSPSTPSPSTPSPSTPPPSSTGPVAPSPAPATGGAAPSGSAPSPSPSGPPPERCSDADFVDPASTCSWRLVLVPTIEASAQTREFYRAQIDSVAQRIAAVLHPSPKGQFTQTDGRFRFVPSFNTKSTSPAGVANKAFNDELFEPKIARSSATMTGLMGNDPLADLTAAQRNTARLEATFAIWRDVIIPSREGDTASINIAGGTQPGITLGSGLFQTATHDFLARLPATVKKLYFEHGFAFEDGKIVALDTTNGTIVSGDDAIRLIAGDQQRMAVFVHIPMSKQVVEVPARTGTEQIEVRLAIARAMFKQIVVLFALFSAPDLDRLSKVSDAEVRKFLVKIFFASTNSTVADAISTALAGGGGADAILDRAVRSLARARICDSRGVPEARLLSTIDRRLSGTRQTRAKGIVADVKRGPC